MACEAETMGESERWVFWVRSCGKQVYLSQPQSCDNTAILTTFPVATIAHQEREREREVPCGN